MVNRTAAVLLAASLLCPQCLAGQAQAQNQLGRPRLPGHQAAELPRRGGTLGMDIGPVQQINENSVAFELLRVSRVRCGSPGARAGFDVGDQIIAVDGHVFPGVAAFAAHVGSVPPGRQIAVDCLPAGGLQQAQRVSLTVGAGGQAATQQGDPARSGRLSTRSKVTIGAGAPVPQQPGGFQ